MCPVARSKIHHFYMNLLTRKFVVFALIPVLAVGVFVLDTMTPVGTIDWVFYLIPMLLSFYAGNRLLPYLLAAVFSILLAVGFYFSPMGMEVHLGLLKLCLGIGVLWMGAFVVSEHQRTTNQLGKLSHAVEQSPVSIIITDKSGNITYANPKFLSVTGYTFGEVVGKNPRILKSDDTRPEEYDSLWKTITAGREWRGQFHNRKKNGELYWERVTIGPIFDDAGQITHFLAVKEDITEYKRLQDALQKSERHYRQFVELNSAGVLCTSLDGHIRQCNDALVEMLGYESQDEIKGHCVTELYFDPDDRRTMLEHLKEHRVLTSYENRFKCRDGSFIWCLMNVSLMEDDDDAAEFIEGTVTDITKRKQAEQLLEFVAQEGWGGAREEFLPRLVEHIGQVLAVDCVYIGLVKDDQTVQTFGLYAKGKIIPDIEYMMRGTPCEQVVGKSFYYFSERVQELFPGDKRLAQIGAQSYFGVPLKDSSGKPLGLLAALHSSPMSDMQVATLLQIAAIRVAGELERRSAESTLRQSEQRYRQLAENSPNAIFIIRDGSMAFANQAGLTLFGATHPDQILNRPFLDFSHPKHREKLALCIANTIEKQQPSPTSEEQFLRLDKSPVEVEVTVIPFSLSGQHAVQLIARDITERNRMQSQMQRLQRMESIGLLAGGIAHDLNNMLTPLMCSIELLKERVSDSEGQKMLQILDGNAHRSADLVKQILTFGRGIEGSRVRLSPARIVREVEQIIRETFPKSIAFGRRTAADLWMISADATQLHQMLLNLCINARDAMPNGGKLSIELDNIVLDQMYANLNVEAKAGSYVVITVRDTGMGIPEEIRHRIFDPFFTTKEQGKGTGLGLSTALGIVHSHGGFINCYSETGKGTMFKVYFPAINATPASSEEVSVAQTRLPRGQNELVLVVDDESSIRQLAQKTLERFGYRVLLAANGAEAVSLYALHQQEIAVVLTDMAMPVMDGPATIVALQSMNPRVKIVGSSGLNTKGHVTKTTGVGIKYFVPKPYTVEAMLQTLNKVLNENATE